MAGVGYQGYFNQDPSPNPIDGNMPSTGAVLNDSGQPEWEPPTVSNTSPIVGSLINPPAPVALPAVGKLERLQQIDELMEKLEKEREELLSTIQDILKELGHG